MFPRDGVQPARLVNDPGIEVQRDGEHHYVLICGDQSIRASGFNAWRLFAALAFMLGIKLPTKLAKGIKL